MSNMTISREERIQAMGLDALDEAAAVSMKG